jgi:hypothetical protein
MGYDVINRKLVIHEKDAAKLGRRRASPGIELGHLAGFSQMDEVTALRDREFHEYAAGFGRPPAVIDC